MDVDIASVFTPAGLALLLQVIIADLTMAGDNVVIIGTLASGLAPVTRRKVLMFGVSMALVFLLGFSFIAMWLLRITGLMLAGGLLLLWVAYNMYGELRRERERGAGDPTVPPAPSKTLFAAAVQIMFADLSMSLDNVLAVAGIARTNPAVLFFGLGFSVLLMGTAASYVAKVIQRFAWIGWVGLLLILKVALTMIWDGAHDMHAHGWMIAGTYTKVH